MVEIRGVWEIEGPLPVVADGNVNALLDLERFAIDAVKLCCKTARAFIDEGNIENIHFLQQSAQADLVAGCELARAGYLKQAYSLWRSWFEQSIFSLYFLEAPIHRAAWKVSSEVSLDDSPQYRLMLHQLLNESGERHPFSLVYGDRFFRLLDALKVSAKQMPKDQRPIARATRVLTMLSQGVHGTYQPKQPSSSEEACTLLADHCNPILRDAAETILVFWLLFLTSTIDPPPDVLIALREGVVNPEALEASQVSEPQMIADLAPLFKRAYGKS